MPSARTDQQRRRLLVQRVLLRAAVERDRAAHRVAQIELPFDVVRPRRRVRVFEVRHEDVRAGVQRVDDHLAIDRPGDLDAAVDADRAGSARPSSRSRGSLASPAESPAARRRRGASSAPRRLASSSSRRGLNSRCSIATKRSASGVRISAEPSRDGPRTSTSGCFATAAFPI